MMQKTLLLFIFTVLLTAQTVVAQTGWLFGVIKDDDFKDVLTGAAVQIDGTTRGVITDFDGNYKLEGLEPGKHKIRISYISYESQVFDVVINKGEGTELNVTMYSQKTALKEVEVVGRRRTDSDISMQLTMRSLATVASGVSAQFLRVTQDRDAGEAVKRIPGVSIVGDRFIVIRGLAQRYNSVWINNVVAPSSEADQRAFSFDVLPSGVIDNILIAKSSLPEYPADFAGGFIKIKTKGTGLKDGFMLSVGTGFDTRSTFRNYQQNPAGNLTWLGFNDGSLSIPDVAKKSFTTLNPAQEYNKLEKIARSFNANWEPIQRISLPDLRLSASYSKNIFKQGAAELSTFTFFNYSNSSSIEQKQVTQWGMFDESLGKPVYLSLNDQTINKESVKLSLLHNWVWRTDINNQYEFRNFLNNQGANRVIERYQDKNPNLFRDTEMSFSNRLTYTGQLSGEHFMNHENHRLDWVTGYSYANKLDPDQKQYTYHHDNQQQKWLLPIPSTYNFFRISNELIENNLSVAANYAYKPQINNWRPEFKVGVLGEYKFRSFDNRWFAYMRSKAGSLIFIDETPNQIMGGDYFMDKSGGIRIKELTERSDSYTASNLLTAGYLSANLPILSWLSLNGGVRIEYNRQQLYGFQQSTGSQAIPLSIDNPALNFFPSAILTFTPHKDHQIKLAYSNGINRPEFREIAPYAFYDFENDVTINGNTKLKDCKYWGLDLRYEFYTSTPGDVISLSGFYKGFTNMIELAQQGSTYPVTYNYTNIPDGKSYGIELEIRKKLGTTGVWNDLSVVLNASLIKSEVDYKTGYENRKREMQGQSPYLVNAGIFYNNAKHAISANVVYNVIGKRIVINGDYSSVTSDQPNFYTPDIYEQPRNVVDLNFSKTFFKKLELRLSIRDILNEPLRMTRTYANGSEWDHSVFNTGSKVTASLVYNF